MVKGTCGMCRFWESRSLPEYYGDKYHYEEIIVEDYSGKCRLFSFDLLSEEKENLNAPIPKAIAVDLDEGTLAEFYTTPYFRCEHYKASTVVSSANKAINSDQNSTD